MLKAKYSKIKSCFGGDNISSCDCWLDSTRRKKRLSADVNH